MRRGLTLSSTSKGSGSTIDRTLSFKEFVNKVRPRYRWFKHCEVLAAVLQRVADGEIRRLMVFWPPRHGKSELVSRLFAAYWLYRFPHKWVGTSAYGATLAEGLSRNARELYQLAGCPISDVSSAVNHWETGDGGGMWAAGVGGGILGKGWHLGIIDDPVKNAEEASSKVTQERNKEWFGSTFYTREEPDENDNPDGALIIIMQRWHEEDLAGWLLKQEEQDDTPERWHVVHHEAIKEAEPPKYPASCTLEPDWRQPGEALCPERRPVEKLMRICRRVGSYFWNALYQQRPRPREGGFFKWAWFEKRFVDEAPVKASRIRYWDTAGTEGDGDFTSGTKVAKGDDGLYYVEHVHRGQWSPGRRNQEMRATAEADGKAVVIWMEREAGVEGTARTQETVRVLDGFAVHTEPAKGAKELRADGFAAQCEAGNVRIVKGTWNRTWINELCDFPNGKNDDQVDSTSGAYNKLADTKRMRAW